MTPLACFKCGCAIEVGAPVWRASTGCKRRHRLGIRCAACRLDQGFAPHPTPCESCARPVYNRQDARWRLHTYCSELCRAAMWSAHQRDRRARARLKARTCTCGKAFTAARRDARYCSAGCKQRAHRYRKAIGSPIRQLSSGNTPLDDGRSEATNFPPTPTAAVTAGVTPGTAVDASTVAAVPTPQPPEAV